MSREAQIPGGIGVQESGAREAQIPGGIGVQETSAAAAATSYPQRQILLGVGLVGGDIPDVQAKRKRKIKAPIKGHEWPTT